MADIWVPGDFTKDKNRRVLVCFTCEATFELDEVGKYERHVDACARRNEDQIEAELDAGSIARKLPSMYGKDVPDPEYERWYKRNAKAILEYRLKP